MLIPIFSFTDTTGMLPSLLTRIFSADTFSSTGHCDLIAVNNHSRFQGSVHSVNPVKGDILIELQNDTNKAWTSAGEWIDLVSALAQYKGRFPCA